MSILTELNFSSERRQADKQPAQLRYRARALELIDEQIQLASDPDHKLTRVTGRKDERVIRERKHGGRMFWSNANGWHAEFRFGGSLVDFSDDNTGMTTMLAGKTLEDVAQVYQVLRGAVEMGELDAKLAAVATRRKHKGETTSEMPLAEESAEPEAEAATPIKRQRHK